MRRLHIVGIIIGIIIVLSGTGCSSSRAVRRAAVGVASEAVGETVAGSTERTADTEDDSGLVADYTVLLQVRDMLAGSATLNWSADRPVADWDGITVSGSPLRVTELDLSERKLTGVIPPQLGTLANLQVLDLHDNQPTVALTQLAPSLPNSVFSSTCSG